MATKDTHNVVILAADGRCVAQTLANTDTSDAGAAEASTLR